MDRADEVGAAAAAEYFLNLYSYVMQTADFVAWDAMATTACDFCIGIRADATEIADGGGAFSGGQIAIATLSVGPHDEGLDAFSVETTINQEPSERTDRNGSVVAEYAGQAGELHVEVINRPQGWGVLAVIGEET